MKVEIVQRVMACFCKSNGNTQHVNQGIDCLRPGLQRTLRGSSFIHHTKYLKGSGHDE